MYIYDATTKGVYEDEKDNYHGLCVVNSFIRSTTN